LAVEVAKGLPLAIVSASPYRQEAKYWASVNHYHNFRAYTQTDITGVEVGGAYKNIIAIATGISDGLGMGRKRKSSDYLTWDGRNYPLWTKDGR